MVVREWSYDGLDVIVSREDAIESATERAAKRHERVVLKRYRPMQHSDLNAGELARDAWAWLRDHLENRDAFCCEDGGPEVAGDLPADDAERLGQLLVDLCFNHVDFTFAAWTETGEELIVTPSGEVLGQLALPIDGVKS